MNDGENVTDFSDFCEIDVQLATPFDQSVQFPVFQRFLQRFPHIFPFIRYILSLKI